MWRRIKAVGFIALIWSFVWAIVGTLGVYLGYRAGLRGYEYAAIARVFAIMGVVTGVAFATIVVIAERRRTFSQLSGLRMSVLGGFGGALLPLIGLGRNFVVGAATGSFVLLTIICAVLGGGLAAGHIAVARRALPKENEVAAFKGSAT